MSEVVVRPSKSEDAAGILATQEAGWLATYPNEEFGVARESINRYFESKGSPEERVAKARERTEKLDENAREWVAEIESHVVGWCVAKLESGETGRLQAIYVHPDAQGQGIGKKLMEQVLSWLGNRDILVNVASYNDWAIGFYERFGFVKTGKTPDSFSQRPNPNRPNIPEIEMKRVAKGL